MTKIGVMSDTHSLVPKQVYSFFEDVDLILHCGDIGSSDVLCELRLFKPTIAVWGNCDSRYELDDVLQATEFNNFDVLVAGPVPPNPSELIDSDKNRALLKELRKRYDYIILDTPPVNLIADAQCLAKESDINLFVVRSEQTNKAAFKISLAELIDRNDVKVNFVFNDIKTVAQKYGYGARYDKGYYGYGYGYGYFDNEQIEK